MNLELTRLTKSWPLPGGSLGQRRMAVDQVSFSLQKGEALALVGESGCGKSTLARLLVGAYPADSGQIAYQGQALLRYDREQRARMVQLIFQDPASALHPRRKVQWQLREALRYTLRLDEKRIEKDIAKLLQAVHLPPTCLNQYPHELSGGQKQRVVIARALALDPEVLIADEALSALDRLTQMDIIELLRGWCDRRQGSLLLIAHDLSAVRSICERVAVMYGGQIMELRDCEALFQAARHPYSRYLLQAMPRLYRPPHLKAEPGLAMGSPQTLAPRSGCVWSARCPFVLEQCRVERPAMRGLSDGSGSVACHRWEELTLSV